MTFWGALPRIAVLSKGTQLENKEGDSSLRLRSVQNDKIRSSGDVMRRSPELLSLCEGSAKGLQRNSLIKKPVW